MKRTHNNNQLTIKNLNEKVTLIGWISKIRDFGKLVFIDLRDRYGICQLVINQDKISEVKVIKNEYLIQVDGKVVKRNSPNKNLATGEIEIEVTNLNIINKSIQTPFIIDDEIDTSEEIRMKYRYLDLRRPIMTNNLIIRHKITRSIREFLDNNDFIEIETPLLTKATPEGARDYLVPSRVNPGKFYALPQSPQLFKQLLMVSGMEKYYQIARCFRDEDLRSDRQPDFTQVDIETSFLSEEQILTLMENMFKKMLKDVKNYDLKTPLPRYSYSDVMNKYGSDKPDTRFGFAINDLYKILENSNDEFISGLIKNKFTIKAINAKNLAGEITRKKTEEINNFAKNAKGNYISTLKLEENNFSGTFSKYLSNEELNQIKKLFDMKNNDLLLIYHDLSWEKCVKILGQTRNYLGKNYSSVDPNTFDLFWVVNFPLFEYDEENKTYSSTHHPFTRPFDEDIIYFDIDPSKIRAHHYDLVMNGYELGSGSLRIYDEEMQTKVFEIIGLSQKEIREKFGFFIDAFKYSIPPHGGVAFGLDRIAMIITNSPSIRDVIAFPKNANAVCPMSDAPSSASKRQLDELHIKLIDKEN